MTLPNNAVKLETESPVATTKLVPRFLKQGFQQTNIDARRRWVEDTTGSQMRHVGLSSIEGESMQGNIENPIGAIQMPLGVAGPLTIIGQHAKGVFYVPLATTEGALVRSYERGMVAITRAGGAQVHVVADGNTASPIFTLRDVAAAAEFSEFVQNHFEQLSDLAGQTTQHGRLMSARPRLVGRDVIVDFYFVTGDAHGMNMVTKAVNAIAVWLASQCPVEHWYAMSGGSSEKRASGALFSGGKGKSVIAGVRLPAKLVKTYLGLTPARMVDVWRRTVVGQIASGVIGYNGHFANGLTALFIATGQDVANIANSAVGITNIEQTSEDELYVSVTLPSLTVATIGGGTGLATSVECLGMLDCVGAGKAKKFAEIAAATVLAGELSFGASLGAGDFADAHEKYGRNRPETPCA